MTESEAIKAIKDNKPASGYYILNEALDMAMQALEKLSKTKEALKKWQKDTHRFYAVDEETADLINKLINILEDNEE